MKYLILIFVFFHFSFVCAQANEKPYFIRQNEDLVFKVSYLGIVGGYASLHSKSTLGSSNVSFIMKAETAPWVESLYTLDMTLTSISKKNRLETIFYEENRFENNRLFYHRLEFYLSKGFFHYSENMNEGETEVFPLLVESLNVVSSFYYTRSLDLSPNKVFYTQGYYRKKIWPIEIHVIKRVKIKTAFGKKKAFLVVPKMGFKGVFLNEGAIQIFISDDQYRCPLKMKSKLAFGYFVADLIKGYPSDQN